MERFRRTVLTVFCAFILFAVAGGAFYGLVDDSPFVPAMSAHLDFALAWLVVEGGSVVAAAALAAGGLPIALTVLRHVWTAARRDLWLLAVPVVAFGVLVVAFVAVAGWLLLSGVTAQSNWDAVSLTFRVLAVIAAAVSAGAVWRLVERAPLGEQTFRAPGLTVVVEPFRFARLPAAVMVLGMLIMLAGTVAWGLLAGTYAPHAFAAHDATLGGPTAAVTYGEIVLAMAVATAMALVAVIRGFATRSRPAAV